MKSIMHIKTIVVVLTMTFIGFQAQAQVSGKPGNLTETAVINTSAQCDMCRMKIEAKLNDVKGVKTASLDIRNKKLTVKYNPEKTNLEEIKKLVSDLGYDAEDVRANVEAYKNLPSCCQKH
jgi:mercuric ion binding protein